LSAIDLALMTERYARLDHLHGGWRRRLKLVLAARWGLRGAGAGMAGGLAVSLAALYSRVLVPEAYAAVGLGGPGRRWPRPGNGVARPWLATAIDLTADWGCRTPEHGGGLRRCGWRGALVRSQLEDTVGLPDAQTMLPLQCLTRGSVAVLLLLISSLYCGCRWPSIGRTPGNRPGRGQERARVGAFRWRSQQWSSLT
jgi:hypothetical protein